MSDLDTTTEIWTLRAKVKGYEAALAQALVDARASGEAAINMAEECHILREGVRKFAMTLREWAVAAGGHTPSAIIASRLLELIGDEKSGRVETEADVKP